jgi:hypothetical protein
MNWGSILQLLGTLFATEQIDKAVIDAGGVASTPKVTIGTDGGKQLYMRSQISTDATFGGTA